MLNNDSASLISNNSRPVSVRFTDSVVLSDHAFENAQNHHAEKLKLLA